MFSRLILSLALLLFMAFPTEAARRLALVIGNDSYANLPADRQLFNAVKDAIAMRDTLSNDLGFTVLYDTNADWDDMNNLIKQLENAVSSGDIVFIYYSGHGVSIGAENFLLPSDLPAPRQGQEDRLMGNSFGAEALTKRILNRGANAIFVVLDACRDSPFVDSAGKSVGGVGGLTRMDAAKGVFTLFAAGLGQTALDRLSNDDPNPNSVVTRSLIPLLKTTGLSQVDLAKKVQAEVSAAAASIGHDQQPAYYDQITGLVTLKEAEANQVVDSNKTIEVVPSQNPANDVENSANGSTEKLLQEIYRHYNINSIGSNGSSLLTESDVKVGQRGGFVTIERAKDSEQSKVVYYLKDKLISQVYVYGKTFGKDSDPGYWMDRADEKCKPLAKNEIDYLLKTTLSPGKQIDGFPPDVDGYLEPVGLSYQGERFSVGEVLIDVRRLWSGDIWKQDGRHHFSIDSVCYPMVWLRTE